MNAIQPPPRPAVDQPMLRMVRIMEDTKFGINPDQLREMHCIMLATAIRTGREVDHKLADFFVNLSHIVPDVDGENEDADEARSRAERANEELEDIRKELRAEHDAWLNADVPDVSGEALAKAVAKILEDH